MPNSIAFLSAFVSMCENFIGCRPHWGLFKHIFTCRSQTVKRVNPSDGKTRVLQACGGLGIQLRNRSAFPPMNLPESIRCWQSTWFYYKDSPTPGQSTGLPPLTLGRASPPPSMVVSKAERAEVDMLMERVVQLVREGLTGMDLFEVYLTRRI